MRTLLKLRFSSELHRQNKLLSALLSPSRWIVFQKYALTQLMNSEKLVQKNEPSKQETLSTWIRILAFHASIVACSLEIRMYIDTIT
jgi:hypothetical protein